MDRDSLIAVLLGILVLVSAVQTYELMSLKGKVVAGAGSTSLSGSPAASSPSSGAAASLPKGLQNLPTQVGGC